CMDQFACIGMARMNWQVIAMFHRSHDGTHLWKIQFWVDALRIEIQRQRNEIDIAGALAIAEQATLDTISACEQRLFRCSHRCASVVMRVDAYDHAVAA